MPSDSPEPNRPFRWNLAADDRLGSTLDRSLTPELFYLDELIECAGRVLARSDDGDLFFVGRSADSMFDLLTGALAGTSWQGRLYRLPLSLFGLSPELSPAEVSRLRVNLNAEGLAPHLLARRRRPVVFVDLVYRGGTYENLFYQLRTWIDDESAQWDVIRRKLRFIGITGRRKTSPNTWRWQQNAKWTSQLPPRAIRNVSIDPYLWSVFGDQQDKIQPSFTRHRWADPEVTAPRRDEETRVALAEAMALVKTGRKSETRRLLARAIVAEPAISQRWLRSLVTELRR